MTKRLREALFEGWYEMTPKEREEFKNLILKWYVPLFGAESGLVTLALQLPTPYQLLLLIPQIEFLFATAYPEEYQEKLRKFKKTVEKYAGKPIEQVREELIEKYDVLRRIATQLKEKFGEKLHKVI